MTVSISHKWLNSVTFTCQQFFLHLFSLSWDTSAFSLTKHLKWILRGSFKKKNLKQQDWGQLRIYFRDNILKVSFFLFLFFCGTGFELRALSHTSSPQKRFEHCQGCSNSNNDISPSRARAGHVTSEFPERQCFYYILKYQSCLLDIA